MNIEIVDKDFGQLLEEQYSLGIFACGYESRSTYIASKVSPGRFDFVTCFSFAESVGSAKANKHRAEFREALNPEFLDLGQDSDRSIYTFLGEQSLATRKISIFVDYSSMTRFWYGAILNWALHNEQFDEIIVDFCYAIGSYIDTIPPIEIKEILCVPGCEGTNISASKSVAVFGLGFDPWGPLCVLDKLEPDKVFAIIADPGANEADAAKARSINEEFIEKHAAGKVVRLPLDSVEVSYQRMLELISPYRGDAQITLICLGPKPHVLTSVLLAMTQRDVSSLHVSSSRKVECDVVVTGKVICTRVHLKRS